MLKAMDVVVMVLQAFQYFDNFILFRAVYIRHEWLVQHYIIYVTAEPAMESSIATGLDARLFLLDNHIVEASKRTHAADEMGTWESLGEKRSNFMGESSWLKLIRDK